MTETITFLHLTDLHVVAPDLADPGVHSDTVATFRAVRAMIEAIRPAPAFALVSGDLTNRGDAASFRTLRELTEGLEIPLLMTLGNHDHPAGFREGFLGEAATDAPYDHDAVMAGVHVIALDTSRRHMIGGMLDDAQFAWLDDRLSARPDLPKLLMIHHPPALDEDPAWEWEGLRFADTRRLGEMIAGRGVAGIFSGHIHQDRVSHWHGAPVIVGTGQHFAMDVLHPGEELAMRAGASFGLCRLRPSGLTVNFVQLPSDRRALGVIGLDRLHAHEAGLRAAAGL